MNVSLYKKSLLFRKAQRKIYNDMYQKKISYFLNTDLDIDSFLSLEKTDAIIDNLYKNKERSNTVVEIGSIPELIDFIKSKIVNVSFYILMDEEWKFCGAYKSDDSVEFNDSFDFDVCTSDEIRIISVDLIFQIQIDYDSGEIECLYVEYEIKD